MTRKSLSVDDMKIVVDNAVIPTKELVAQAVESIVLEDYPRNSIDQLGLSCMCVLDESEYDSSINSEDDDDDNFEPTSQASPVSQDFGCSRWSPTLHENMALVCPVRLSSRKDALKSRKRSTVREVPASLYKDQTAPWQSKKESVTQLLASAIAFAGKDTRGSPESIMNNSNTRNTNKSVAEILDEAVAFASKDLRQY
jgi:hypothetical protein